MASQSNPPTAPKKRTTKASQRDLLKSWKFAAGCVGFAIASFFFFFVVFFGQSDWAGYKLNVVGIFAATFCASIAGLVFRGYFKVQYKGAIFGFDSLTVTAGGIFAVWLITLGAWFYFTPLLTTYRVTIYLRDDLDNPVTEAEIHPELKETVVTKTATYWELVVPYYNKPKDGPFRILATNQERFLRGEAEINWLAPDRSQLESKWCVIVRAFLKGTVRDEATGIGLPDAIIYTVGNENEKVRSGPKGEFQIPANAAPGERIRVQAEKEGYEGKPVYAMAGYDAEIELTKKKK